MKLILKSRQSIKSRDSRKVVEQGHTIKFKGVFGCVQINFHRKEKKKKRKQKSMAVIISSSVLKWNAIAVYDRIIRASQKRRRVPSR